MKIKIHIYFLFFLLIIISLNDIKAQSACPNADFSMNNFTNWTGFTGVYTNCCPTQGFVANRHQILTTQGTDPRTGNNLQLIPPGSNFSAKLGNEGWNAQAERLRYTMTVTPQNSLFIYKYAVVLEDPGHTQQSQPKFEIRVLDASNNIIDPICGFYSVYAGGGIPGFQLHQIGNKKIRWRNWTNVGIDLTPYIGQNVTIEYTTYDCKLGAHFGYAYLAAACGAMGINVDFCHGSNNVNIQAPDGFASYLWSPGGHTTQNVQINNPTIGATYTCLMTSHNGCQVTLSAVLNPTIVNALFQHTVDSCIAQVTLQDFSTVNIGVIDTWHWNFGDGTTSSLQNPTHTYASSGTYTITLTVTSNGCTSTLSKPITIHPLPIANAGNDQIICVGQSANFTASGGGAYIWSTGAATQNINVSPTITTTYYVTATNALGCTASDDVIVTVNNLPNAQAGNNVQICSGFSTQLNATGGIHYSWSPTTGLSATNIANPLANPNSTTTYIVNVTDMNGCTNTDNIVVSVAPLPIVDAGPNQNICLGEQAQLSASGGVQYVWNTGTNGATLTVSPTVTTTYTVTATDAFGCTGSDNVVVTVFPQANANAGNNTLICLGHSAQLLGSGGVNYLWTPSIGLNATNIPNPIATPTNTTTYTVSITDINGCTATDDVIVSINPLPIVDAGSNASICWGTSTTLNGVGGGQFNWSPTQSLNNPNIINPIATPTITTTYTLTITDNNGCTGSDNVVVTVMPLPVANAGNDQSICLGNQATLAASGGDIYLWSNGQNTAHTVVSPIIETTYTVTVSFFNGCSSTDDVVVSIYNNPIAFAGNDTAICLGNSIPLNATGGISYFWTPSMGLNISSIPNPIANPTVTTTYTVSISDINGCSASDDIVITILPLPPAHAGINNAICFGQSTTLNASGGIIYNWAPNTSLNTPNISNPIATPTATTTYTVSVTDINGCLNTSSVIITVHALPPADAGPNISICEGTQATLTASGGVLYNWNTGDNTDVIHVSPLSSTQYIVTVTDINGCSASDSILVSINYPPIVNAGNNVYICEGTTTILTATGGVSYTWSPAAGLSNEHVQSPIATPSVSTLYTVTVTDINGCTNTDDVFVGLFPSPTVVFSAAPMQGCQPHEVQFTDHTNYPIQSWLWNFGDYSSANNSSTLSNPIHIYYESGLYDVTLQVTTTDGCISYQTVPYMVEVFAVPVANFGMTPSYVSLDNSVVYFEDLSYLASSWQWNFGEPSSGVNNISSLQNPHHSYASENTFTISLMVQSSNGCIDSTSKMLTVQPTFSFYIPNAFTPNADGNNDFFQGYGTNIDEYQMYIFSRWGKLLYETNSYNSPWNGKHANGELAIQDVYVYKIIVKDNEQTTHTYYGRVTLLR